MSTRHAVSILPSVLQDDATMASLTAQDKHGDVKGWAHRVYAWLFEGDLFAGVATDNKLMRIHSTAEQFDPAAEETLVPFQVTWGLCSRFGLSHATILFDTTECSRVCTWNAATALGT